MPRTPTQELPIYNPVARDHDDARQHGQRDLIERHGQSQCDYYRVRDACNLASTTCLEVEECSRACAAGLPPIKPAAMLPAPWAISSRFG